MSETISGGASQAKSVLNSVDRAELSRSSLCGATTSTDPSPQPGASDTPESMAGILPAGPEALELRCPQVSLAKRLKEQTREKSPISIKIKSV